LIRGLRRRLVTERTDVRSVHHPLAAVAAGEGEVMTGNRMSLVSMIGWRPIRSVSRLFVHAPLSFSLGLRETDAATAPLRGAEWTFETND
jgi:hypothetical protein